MRFECWVNKVRIETSIFIIQYLLNLHVNNGYANTPSCYVVRTLPVLSILSKTDEPQCVISTEYRYGSGPSTVPYTNDVVTESLGRRRRSILVRQLQERRDRQEPVLRVAVG